MSVRVSSRKVFLNLHSAVYLCALEQGTKLLEPQLPLVKWERGQGCLLHRLLRENEMRQPK